MKTLYLVRHAKSSRDDPAIADRDRPLNDRGERDADAMGRRLAGRGVKPERLLSSPARRALATAKRFADGLGVARAAIVLDDRLYASSAGELLAVIQALDDRWHSAMLFGHNPETSELAGRLSGRFVDLPTCAVVELRFDTTRWADLGAVAADSALTETSKD
jgi:phosphohistidine phosphatase